MLEGLTADFAAAEADLDRAMTRHNEVVEATARRLVMSREAAPSPSLAAVADSLVSEMLWATLGSSTMPTDSVDATLKRLSYDNPTPHPRKGAWIALSTTGLLSAIQDRDLVVRLN